MPPFLRHSPTLPKYQLHNDKSLFCLVSVIVRNNQQEAAQPCANRTVSSVRRPFSPAPGCPDPPSIARSPKAPFPHRSRSAPMALAGRNPTSIAGSPTRSDGGSIRSTNLISLMTSDRNGDHKPVTASRSRDAKRPPTASEQLEELLGYPWPFPGRPPKHDLSTWTVTEYWSDPVPVTSRD